MTRKAFDRLIAHYDYKLTARVKSQLSKVFNGFEQIGDLEIGHMIFVLDQCERRLNRIHQLRSELEKLNSHQGFISLLFNRNKNIHNINHQLQIATRVTHHFASLIVEIAIGSIMVGCKVNQEEAIWNKEFIKHFPSIYSITKLNIIERNHLKALQYHILLKKDEHDESTRLCEIFRWLSTEDLKAIEQHIQHTHFSTSTAILQKGIFKTFKTNLQNELNLISLTKQIGSKDDAAFKPAKHQQSALFFFHAKQSSHPPSTRETPIPPHANNNLSV